MTIVVFRAMLARGSRDSPPRNSSAQEENYPSAHTATPQLSLEEGVSPEIEAMVLSHRKEVVASLGRRSRSRSTSTVRTGGAEGLTRNVGRKAPSKRSSLSPSRSKDKENVHSNRQRHEESRNLQSKMRKERLRSSPQKRARDLSQKRWHKKNRQEEEEVSPYIYHLVTRVRTHRETRKIIAMCTTKQPVERVKELVRSPHLRIMVRQVKQSCACSSEKIMSNNDSHPPKAKSADELINHCQRRLREEARQEALQKAHLEAEANKVDSPTKKYQVTPDFVDPTVWKKPILKRRSVETVLRPDRKRAMRVRK